jgi:hypothetical protein
MLMPSSFAADMLLPLSLARYGAGAMRAIFMPALAHASRCRHYAVRDAARRNTLLMPRRRCLSPCRATPRRLLLFVVLC